MRINASPSSSSTSYISTFKLRWIQRNIWWPILDHVVRLSLNRIVSRRHILPRRRVRVGTSLVMIVVRSLSRSLARSLNYVFELLWRAVKAAPIIVNPDPVLRDPEECGGGLNMTLGHSHEVVEYVMVDAASRNLPNVLYLWSSSIPAPMTTNDDEEGISPPGAGAGWGHG